MNASDYYGVLYQFQHDKKLGFLPGESFWDVFFGMVCLKGSSNTPVESP